MWISILYHLEKPKPVGRCCLSSSQQSRRSLDTEARKAYMKAWQAKNKDKMAEYRKKRQEPKLQRQRDTQALRAVVFEKLGGRCLICGWDDYRALQIDHVKGGGSLERRKFGSGINFLLRLLDDPLLVQKYQLLCANHNWVKRHDNGEVKGYFKA